MAFYDSRKKGIFNVAGVGLRSGNDSSTNYAQGLVDNDTGKYKRSPSYLVFYNATTGYQKTLAFKGFLESYNLKLNNEYKIEDTSGNKKVTKGASLFEYNISISVPSYSVNEGMNNLAKFQELERIFSISLSKYSELQSTGTNFIDPKVYVAFSNLIQNGKYSLGSSVKFPHNEEAAMRCVVKDFTFQPDLEMGFFEFNSNFIPKFYTLNLLIVPIMLNTITGILTMNGFNSDGNWSRDADLIEKENSKDPNVKASAYKEVTYWPFGLRVSNGNYGTLNLRTINSYPNPRANKDGSDAYAKSKKAFLAFSTINSDINKWVVFKSFLESFSYSKNLGYRELKSQALSGNGSILINKPERNYNFKFKINVPAHSVNEAINNLAKINVLFRMCLEFIPNAASGEKKSFRKGQLYVSLANLIHNPASNKIPDSYPNSQTVIENGLKCVMKSINMDIDTEMGFFEFGNHFIPKMFTLDFDLELVAASAYGSMFETNGLLGNADSAKWPFNMDYIKGEEDA